MAIITAIEVQKKNKHRFNIYVDDHFKVGVHEDTLVALRLQKGMPFTDYLEKKIQDHNEYQSLYLSGLNYLSYSLRTKQEVSNKLLGLVDSADDAYDQHVELVEKVLARLTEDKYINDAAYLDAYLQNNQATTKKGPYALEEALLAKGISKDLIAEKLANQEDTYLASGLEVAEKYAKKQNNLSTLALIQKVKQHLIQKGYSFSQAQTIVSSMNLEQDEDDLKAAIQVQGDKVWRKYAKQYKGYDLKQKVQQALYQKGFDSALIKDYLAEKQEQEND